MAICHHSHLEADTGESLGQESWWDQQKLARVFVCLYLFWFFDFFFFLVWFVFGFVVVVIVVFAWLLFLFCFDCLLGFFFFQCVCLGFWFGLLLFVVAAVLGFWAIVQGQISRKLSSINLGLPYKHIREPTHPLVNNNLHAHC